MIINRWLAASPVPDVYICQQSWPDFEEASSGGQGVPGNYFFFECLLWIYGEYVLMRKDSAVSIEDAEQKLWVDYQKILACPANHADLANFDRKDYKNGLGFCKHCNFKTSKLGPTTHCCKCNRPSYYHQDTDGNFWCEPCKSKK